MQVIFVTDDEKAHWWLTIDSGGPKRIGPRPELVEEAAREGGVKDFFILTSERFAPLFARLLKIQLHVETIAQVEDVKSTLSVPVIIRLNEPKSEPEQELLKLIRSESSEQERGLVEILRELMPGTTHFFPKLQYSGSPLTIKTRVFREAILELVSLGWLYAPETNVKHKYTHLRIQRFRKFACQPKGISLS